MHTFVFMETFLIIVVTLLLAVAFVVALRAFTRRRSVALKIETKGTKVYYRPEPMREEDLIARVRETAAWAGTEHGQPGNPTGVEAVAPTGDDVRFTAYRPSQMVPEQWYQLLVFVYRSKARPDAAAHEPPPAAQARMQAMQLLGPAAPNYIPATEDSAAPLALASQLTIVPDIPGLVINPPTASILWLEDVHNVEFRMRAPVSLEGRTARGRVSIF